MNRVLLALALLAACFVVAPARADAQIGGGYTFISMGEGTGHTPETAKQEALIDLHFNKQNDLFWYEECIGEGFWATEGTVQLTLVGYEHGPPENPWEEYTYRAEQPVEVGPWDWF